MKLLEYKGKELLKKVGISIPAGILLTKDYDDSQAQEFKRFFSQYDSVISKAQVVGGGRKKYGLVTTYSKDFPGLELEIAKEFSKRYKNVPIESVLVE